jgi:hypothetical protein
MWRRKKRSESKYDESQPQRLREALRQARIESAERTGTVVDLRDAELARLELLNDALDPLYAEIPDETELFDRGISRGETPRLWIDPVAHVHMGRDKRVYRFVQDGRYGRKLLAETAEIEDVVAAITRYVARRLLERERALAADERPGSPDQAGDALPRRRRHWRAVRVFAFGVIIGIAAVFAAAWWLLQQAP